MFRRRSLTIISVEQDLTRFGSKQHVNSNPSASAATAAAQAYLSHRASNASLSAAAAAAALRSHTPPPTSVADVQTARILRRQASASSNGTNNGGPGTWGPGKGLQRKSSSGSMSERSFRDASPARGPSPRDDLDAPPVPALPKHIPAAPAKKKKKQDSGEDPPEIPRKSHRRTTSLEPINTRGRGGSHAKQSLGRGVSVDRGTQLAHPGLVAALRASGVSSPQHSPYQRPDSRSSVNFSYPRSATMSPVGDRRLSTASIQSEAARLPVNGTAPRELPPSGRPSKPKKKKADPKTNGEAARPDDEVASDAPRSDEPTNVGASAPAPTSASASPAAKKRKKKKKIATQSESFSPATPTYQSDLESISELDDGAYEESTPSKSRAAGLLTKQPSIVREEREKEELEDAASQRGNDAAVGPRGGGLKKPPKQRSKKGSVVIPETTDPSARGEHLKTPAQGQSGGAARDRPSSLSPTRYAHFGPGAPLTSPDVTKHHPPLRSVSPVKSAMKHSPSRTSSPASQSPSVANADQHGRRLSGYSDGSLLSDDGSHAHGSTRKKQARVSFDEGSVIIGQSATPPDTPLTPQVLSPQHGEPPKKRWFAFGKKRDGEGADLIDDTLKPRPELPSFGSVREQKERKEREERDGDDAAKTDVSTDRKSARSSLSDSTWATWGPDQGKSTLSAQPAKDEAVDKADKITSGHDPIPPEVTSVEGDGQDSGTDDGADVENSRDGSPDSPGKIAEDHADSHRALVGDTVGDESGHDEQNLKPTETDGPVPSIELVQPTPTTEQTEFIHGASAGEDESESTEEENRSGKQILVDHHATDPTPATVGIAEPEPEAAAANHSPGVPAVGEVAKVLRLQTGGEIDKDGGEDSSSVYSDAAEDLSDIEGDGFGSINAVVDSPVGDRSPGLALTTPPDSPLVAVSPTTKTKATKKKKTKKAPQSRLQPGVVEDADPGLEDLPTFVEPKSKNKKKAVTAELSPLSTGQVQSAEAVGSNKIADKQIVATTKTKPPAKGLLASVYADSESDVPTTHLRKSMRGSAPPAPRDATMRQSMRNGTNKKSMGGINHPPPAVPHPEKGQGSKLSKGLPKTTRPSSAPVSGTDWAAAVDEEVRNMPRLAAAGQRTSKAGTGPSLRRNNTNDSDSSSSFRRTKPRAASGGGFSMRRTLRDENTRPASHQAVNSLDASMHAPKNPSSRFSLRSNSPPGSPSPSTPLGRGTMRGSARTSVDSAAPSLRSGNKGRGGAKSPSRFSGFGKASKPKTKPAKGGREREQHSRFSDSSDEDEGWSLPKFSSRFADSSDEDETGSTAFTPVRGIPRRIGEEEGESTDLPDSSDEEAKKSKKKTKNSLPPKTTASDGTELPAASTLPTEASKNADGSTVKSEKKKRSFFGMGRHKDSKKAQKGETNAAVTPDAAPTLGPLELDPTPRAVNGITPQPSATSPTSPTDTTTRPKLAKRNTSRMTAPEISWPLPNFTPNDGSENRPSTADGPLQGKKKMLAGKSGLGNKSSSIPVNLADAAAGADNESVTTEAKQAGKKKKFGKLRRALGLRD
ncbi:MAG: hypothetical protein M1825_002020 [Sarcosagium campestre]|nr:MAG: hypothetical protein M1825_002020 [Sarcosagium campestre]